MHCDNGHDLESPEKGVSVEGLPGTNFGLWAGLGVQVGAALLLIAVGGLSLLWAPPFPRQVTGLHRKAG